MMVEGHKMDVIYTTYTKIRPWKTSLRPIPNFCRQQGCSGGNCKRAERIEELLEEADIVSIHTVLDASTHHLIDSQRLALMKENAILINTSRGPVIDETALVAHSQKHPNFKAGLDVFEDEPAMKPGLRIWKTWLSSLILLPPPAGPAGYGNACGQ